jgi:peptide/nickel transport system substrate-binding protein
VRRGDLTAGLVLVALAGTAGCGGGNTASVGGHGSEGGSITISETSQPDFLDPALTYTTNGTEPLWLVYTPLLTYKHAEGTEGTELIPGLARQLPKISSDGKTYELTLRSGLKYSDGSPVKASDWEHALKRVLHLESGGSGFFLPIEGAEQYVKAGNAGADIPGVETDNKTGTITIRLTQPDGSFSNVLAMWFTGLVPGKTPFKNETDHPPPGIGPYKVTSSVPNRQFVLEKNGLFNVPGIPKGHVDKITVKIVKSAEKQAQDVISGSLDYMQDPPPADIKPEIKARYSDRYAEFPTSSTYYMFLNTRVPPFDNKEVRDGVNLGLDKPGLARLFAGEIAPGCSFLPPGMPGYDEHIDGDECPWGNPTKPPAVQKARQMIQAAGAAGAKVTVWGNNEGPSDEVTQAYADQLNKLGLDATPRIIGGTVYFQAIGSAKTRAQTGLANWFADFPHPKDFMFVVDGKSIQPTNNHNPGNVDDPEITAEIQRLNRRPIDDATTEEWRALNAKLVERGWVVPYGHRKLATFLSERMDFKHCTLFHPVYANDYSSFCLK